MKVCELFDNPLYTYETSLETQAPGDREWESHISSSGQKLQQQRGAPWSRQKYRYTYETSLETQAPGDREWESHISSSGQKLQQQRGAPWSRQKYRARMKINKKQDQQNLEKGGLDEVGSTRGRVHMGKTVEEGPARNLVPPEVSV